MTFEKVVKRAQKLTTDYNKKHSIVWLFTELFEIDHTEYYLNLDKKISKEEESKFFFLVNKYLNEKIPVQYLVGHSYFYGRKFFVSNKTLIPRSETEGLIEQTIALIEKVFGDKKLNILDLATGSGCIGITMKLETNANVVISDISNDALEIATKNINQFGLDIKVITSDWFNKIKGNFDVIIANPPYISNESEVMDIVNQEPHNALYSGVDGLDSYRKILRDANDFLNNPGIIAFEHGYDQKDELFKIARNYFKEASIMQIKDLAKLDRYTFIINGDINE